MVRFPPPKFRQLRRSWFSKFRTTIFLPMLYYLSHTRAESYIRLTNSKLPLGEASLTWPAWHLHPCHWNETITEIVILTEHSTCSPTFPGNPQALRMGHKMSSVSWDSRNDAISRWKLKSLYVICQALFWHQLPRRPCDPDSVLVPIAWVPEWLCCTESYRLALDMAVWQRNLLGEVTEMLVLFAATPQPSLLW